MKTPASWLAGLQLEVSLPLYLSAVLALTIGAFSWGAYFQVRRSILGAADQNLARVVGQLVVLLRAGVSQRVADVSEAAAARPLPGFLRQRTGEAAVLAVLRGVTARDSLNVALEIWSAGGTRSLIAGRALPALPGEAARALIETTAASGTGLGPLRAVSESLLLFPVIQAVRAGPGTLGYAVLWRRVRSTSQATRGITQLIGEDATLLVGNADGRVWTDLSRQVPGPAVEVGRRAGLIEYRRRGPGDAAGGTMVLARAAAIAGTPWWLVVEVPRDRILDPARTFLTRIGAIALVIVVGGAGGVWGLSRRMAEPFHREAEARFRTAVESAPNGMVMIDRSGKIVLVNREIERLFGYDREELLGQRIERLVPQRFREGHPGLRAAFLEAPQARAMGAGRELFGLRKDGTEVPVEIGLNPIEEDEGRFVLASVVDITARQQADARFRAAVESAPNGMVMIDRAGKIILVNREIERLFGYTREELLGQAIERLVPQRLRERHPGLRTAFFEAPQTRAMGAGRDLFGVRKDGTEIPVEIGLNPIETEEGLFVLASVVDISARKRAEIELHRSNEELERFAYVASHDLQEPLRMVGSYVQLLGKRYKGKLDADADEFIGFALDGALRMQRLIEDLLAFSRVGSRGGALVATDAGAALQGALAHLRLTIEETGAGVSTGPLPMVAADPGQLEHLFLNLVSNALKFHGAEPPAVQVSARPGDDEAFWVFSVRDNGIGIEERYFDRIFVIFQRLHGRDEYPGTGIGLAICKKIVERHGGRIWVESSPGRGTTFSFTLLAAKQA